MAKPTRLLDKISKDPTLLKVAHDVEEKMIEDDYYCMDISTQLLAVMALLKKANTFVISRHLETCVKEAILSNNAYKKIKEM